MARVSIHDIRLSYPPQIYYLMYWYDKQITLLILSYLPVQFLSELSKSGPRQNNSKYPRVVFVTSPLQPSNTHIPP